MRSGGAILMLLSVACASSAPTPAPRPHPSAAEIELRSRFARNVEPIVMYRCAGCHGLGGCCSPFLTPRPDVYTTVKAWPHLVGSTPSRSLLYAKGEHEGPAFPRTEAQVIAAWIRAEASGAATFRPSSRFVR
jgi:mono/diheme cytochrome c family protein